MKKNNLYHLFLSFLVILAAVGFHFSALAQEVTSTPESVPEIVSTSTPEIISLPMEEPVVSTPPSEPAPVEEPPAPAPEPAPTLEPVPEPPPSAPEPAPESAPAPPVVSEVELEPPPAETPSFEPPPQPIIPPGETPVVPYTRTDGKAFDPFIAPSKVRLKILDNAGNAPTVPVFVSFIGVGGRNYGGPIDREGAIEVILPTGRYYADVLVIAANLGPPQNLPAFFLEANEERDFGVFTLTDKSSFADPVLENEIASTLDSGSGKGGFAKIFALIVKLLLAILREIRGLRSELLVR